MKHLAEPQDIKKKLINGLRQKGYKLTPQRIEIIDLLSKEPTHPGAMDILKKVRKKAPQVSMSKETVDSLSEYLSHRKMD